MNAVDSSVTVPAFASWHEYHEPARTALARGPHLPVHVALETYAVLTRLPPPHRVVGTAVHQFLAENFPTPWLALTPEGHRSLLERLAELELSGGAAYDALVAATAREAEAELLTADRRARPVYEGIGVAFELIV